MYIYNCLPNLYIFYRKHNFLTPYENNSFILPSQMHLKWLLWLHSLLKLMLEIKYTLKFQYPNAVLKHVHLYVPVVHSYLGSEHTCSINQLIERSIPKANHGRK